MFNAYYATKRYETATVIDGVRYEHVAIRRRRPLWQRNAA
jgi:hypothetical protein